MMHRSIQLFLLQSSSTSDINVFNSGITSIALIHLPPYAVEYRIVYWGPSPAVQTILVVSGFKTIWVHAEVSVTTMNLCYIKLDYPNSLLVHIRYYLTSPLYVLLRPPRFPLLVFIFSHTPWVISLKHLFSPTSLQLISLRWVF